MQIESLRRRLVLDWLAPLAGFAVVLGWGAFFLQTPVDPGVSPVVQLLDSAFSSWVGKGYLCLLAIWWTYRLISYGRLRALSGVVAIALQSSGFLLFSLESPVRGVVLIAAGLGIWALAPGMRDQPSPMRPKWLIVILIVLVVIGAWNVLHTMLG